MASTKTSNKTGRTSGPKKSTLRNRRPMGGMLAVVVAAVSVIGGYALLSGSFAATGSGTPEITSGVAHKCLDDYRNNAASGAIVDIWDCNGTPAQQWTMTDKTNGQIRVHGKCLDVYQSSASAGAKVDLYGCKTANKANQTWTFNATTRQIVSALQLPSSFAVRSLCLTAQGSQNRDGVIIMPCTTNAVSPVGYQHQTWDPNATYTKVASSGGSGSNAGAGSNNSASSTSSNSPEQVQSGYSGQCMDDYRNNSANGAKVDLFQCNGTAAQKWTRQGPQGKQQIMIHGKCLDVFQQGTSDGFVLDLYACKSSNNNNQLWNVTNGQIVGVGSKKCVNAPDPRDGFQLQIWTCDGRNSERWVFKGVNSTGGGSGSGGSGGSGNTGGGASTSGRPPEIRSGIKVNGVANHCMDDFKNAQANLSVIDIYSCNGTAAQQFTFSAQQIMIHGKCADVYRQGKAEGTIVELYKCNGGANQKWNYVNNTFISHQSHLCLNAPGPTASADPYNGQQLQIWKCDGRASELWYFDHYTPPAPKTTGGAGSSGAGNGGTSSGSGTTSGSGTGTGTSSGFPGVTNTAGPCDPNANPFCPPTDGSGFNQKFSD
jgi:hypothetical protein